MNRARPVFLLLAAALVLGAAPVASAQAPLRVGKAQDTPFDFVPPDVGLAKGIFKAHGVDIELISFAGSAKLQQALAAGAIDVGLGSGPELAFVAKGSPELGVAAYAGRPDGLVLVVQNDGPVKTVADLKGRSITVSTVGSLTEWAVRETSRQQGWGPDGINIVFLGDIAGQIAALKTKQIDGMSSDIGSATHLEQDGIGRILMSFGTIAPNFINHITYATNDEMDKRPDQLRAFMAAWFETIAWMRKNKDETDQIVQPVMHQPPDVVSRAYDVVMPSFSDTGKFEEKALAVLRRSFVQMNLLPSEPDMSKLYTEKFLPGAS
jgi:ABC-type nitrate/sulfonate/bicarbonate transport system substrate-binding protein